MLPVAHRTRGRSWSKSLISTQMGGWNDNVMTGCYHVYSFLFN